MHLRDRTTVEDVERPRRIQLSARARPFDTARVTLEFEPEGDGTRVTTVESPASALSALLFQPITHLLVRARIRRSLRRLRRLAEGSMPSGRLPDRDGGGAENGARPVRNPAHAERERRGTSFESIARRLARAGAVTGVAAVVGATVGVATGAVVVLLRPRGPRRRGGRP
ncbi:MAG TPA: SRPBCC family protein [Thermoleophilaceae bacterium]|nr:SRPBCC family protein [Thermoleophilaceae bacterium]